MTKKLLIVFVSGLVLSIVALSSAWLIGGKEVMAREGFSFLHDGDRDRGPTVTRDLAFDAGRILRIDAPVSLRFSRGPEVRMTVSGPARLMEALRWENGELSLGDVRGWRHRELHVTITAPQIAGLALQGPGDVELRDLDQPSLLIETRGPANVEASGRVGSLDIDSRGVGALDLAQVDAVDAKVRVHGVGSVDIKASGAVDASLSGVGNITLHREPASLSTRTQGVGSVHHDYDEADAAADEI